MCQSSTRQVKKAIFFAFNLNVFKIFFGANLSCKLQMIKQDLDNRAFYANSMDFMDFNRSRISNA